jgi:hypothetical protein
LTQFQVYGALTFGSERSLFRYCNIDADPDATTNVFDPLVLIRKIKPYLRTPGGGNAVMFVPPSIYGMIEAMAWDKGNASYTLANIEGFGLTPRIVGIPVRPWEAISENESAVPAA